MHLSVQQKIVILIKLIIISYSMEISLNLTDSMVQRKQ